MKQLNEIWKAKVSRTSFLSLKVMFMILAILLTTQNCSKNTTEPEPASYTSVIDGAGDFEKVTENEAVTDSTEGTFEENGTSWLCTTKTYSVTQAPSDFPNFNPNAEVVFPGNLLQGKTINDATPEPISVRRAPGTIVMTILNGGNNYSETVDEINLDNVINAQNQILSNVTGPVPANFTYETSEVNSTEELALSLKVNVQSLTTGVKSSLSFSSGENYNRYLVKLNQSYFTMVYQLPTSYEEVFPASVTPEDLQPFIGAGNPPCFISSVTYGRIFYLLIESTESKETMKASISGSFQAGISGGSLGAGVKQVSALSNVNVKAYALGGDGQLAIAAVVGGFDELSTYLQEGGDILTGVPLSYNIRALKKPYPVVSGKVATEYDVKTCVPIAISSQHELFWYRADSLLTWENGEIAEWGDAFGNQNKAVRSPGYSINDPELIMDAVNGKPALKFRNWLTGEGAKFSNSPAHFVNTNYTVFAVVNIPASHGLFLKGDETAANKMLIMGYRDQNTFTLEHYGQALNVSTTNLGDFQLFTMSFSVTDGSSVYENGIFRGNNVNNTSPLVSNDGTAIGYWSVASQTGMVAEIVAYGTALDDISRQTVEEILMRKYALGAYGN